MCNLFSNWLNDIISEIKHFHFTNLLGISRLKVSQYACFHFISIRILRPITASSLNNFQFSSRKVLLFIHKEFFQIVHFCFIAISFWIYDHRTFSTQIKCLDIFCYLLSGNDDHTKTTTKIFLFARMNTEHIVIDDDLVLMRCNVSYYRYYSLIKTTDQITHLLKGQNFRIIDFIICFKNSEMIFYLQLIVHQKGMIN